ncbi:MAG: hypothetical protein AB1644_06350 [Candidatus Zixiibacteriota bacterium]
MIKAAILTAVATVTAYPLDFVDTWRFPENEQYGYVCLKPATDSTHGSFLIVRYTGAGSSYQKPYLVIDSLGSSTPPQLCDSYAVSYTICENDSARLVVAYFDHAPRHDTIMTYLDNPSKVFPRGVIKMPDNRVFCLSGYCFILHDSMLCWEAMAGFREFVEVGRIGPTGSYMSRSWHLCSQHPSFANDLSHVLFSAYMCGPPHPSSEWNTRILAYYPDADTVLLLFHSEASCTNPQRRSVASNIYCLAVDSRGSINLARLHGDSLVFLTSFSPPESVCDYYLYQDSVLLFTTRGCFGPPGTRRWTLIEGNPPLIRPSR